MFILMCKKAVGTIRETYTLKYIITILNKNDIPISKVIIE